MPRLPDATDLGMRPTPRPGTQVASYQPGIEASANARMGQTMFDVGSAILEAQRKIDETRAEDALNQLQRERLDMTVGEKNGFTNIKAQGVATTNFLGDYRTQFNTRRQAIAEMLGNDSQREYFNRRAEVLTRGFEEDLLRHSARETQAYMKQVFDGTMETQLQDVRRNWNDPKAVGVSAGFILRAVENYAKNNGLADEAKYALRKNALSEIHLARIDEAVAAGDIGIADKILNEYASEIDPAKTIKIRQQIQTLGIKQKGTAAAAAAVEEMRAKALPTDFDVVVNITRSIESGGRQFGQDGRPLVSSAGAIGTMQIMPATAPEAAKMAGLPWKPDLFNHARDGSPKDKEAEEYNLALGRAYLGTMLQRFGGDVEKALAAYNAGEGTVKKAVAKAEKAQKLSAGFVEKGGRPDTGMVTDWRALMPQETKDYLAKYEKLRASGQGAGARPTLVDVQDRAAQLAGPNPMAQAEARKNAEMQWRDFEVSHKAMQDQIESQSVKALFGAGGDMNAIQPQVLASLDGDRVVKLNKVADEIRKFGGVKESDPVAFLNAQRPDFLMSLTDDEAVLMQAQLTESDWKQAMQKRASLRSDQRDQVRAGMGAVNAVIDRALIQRGIDPNPKNKTGSEAKRVAMIRDAINQDLLAEGRATPERQVEIVTQFFARNWKDRMFGAEIKKYSDIPKTEATAIARKLALRGIPPTEDEILKVYLTNAR